MAKIFLAHAREDKAEVRKLHADLKARGFDPWLDKVDLLPGENWEIEIPKAIRQAGAFLACLSSRSVDKVGYIQKEFRFALSEFSQRPPGSIYLIPVRLDDCEVPDLQDPQLGLRLRAIHWVDLWEEDGFDKLVRSIKKALVGIAPDQVPERVPDSGTGSLGLDSRGSSLHLIELSRKTLEGLNIKDPDETALDIVAEAAKFAPDEGYKEEISISRIFCGALVAGTRLQYDDVNTRMLRALVNIMQGPRWQKVREDNISRFHYDNVEKAARRLQLGFSPNALGVIRSAANKVGHLRGDDIVTALLNPKPEYSKGLLYSWIPNIDELRRQVQGSLST